MDIFIHWKDRFLHVMDRFKDRLQPVAREMLLSDYVRDSEGYG